MAIPFLVVALAAACYAYRTTPVVPVPGARVRLVLLSETAIVTAAPARDGTRGEAAGVLELSGWVVSAASDTVAVRLGELRTAAGALPDVEGRIALVPAARIARIEERRFQAGTTLLAGAGFAVITTGVLMVLLIATLVMAAR